MMLRAVTPRSSCEGGQVTGNTTISHNGGNIGVVSGTCPTSGGAKRSTLEERQYSLCAGTPTQGTCECFPQSSQLRVELLGQRQSTENICAGYTVTCENLGTSTILTADCQNLYNYLASYPGKHPNLNSVQTVLFLTTVSFGTVRLCRYSRWHIPKVDLGHLCLLLLESRRLRVRRLLYGNFECHPTHVNPWDSN